MSETGIDNAAAWNRHSARHQADLQLSTEVAQYGPDIPDESELRLLGDLKGKRVLELGCGGAQCSIAFAKAGATAIAVDFSSEQLAHARQLVEKEEVRIELRQGDLADLAFLRADSIDLVFSAYAFGYVEDLNRVFRQAHRVLKVGSPLVFSLRHPAYAVLDDRSADPVKVARSYFDAQPVQVRTGEATFLEYPHTFAEIFTGLSRASYRVDSVVEPEPRPSGPRTPLWRDAMRQLPPTLIIRARKEGN
jgi:SAM-dependent methyltransferase